MSGMCGHLRLRLEGRATVEEHVHNLRPFGEARSVEGGKAGVVLVVDGRSVPKQQVHDIGGATHCGGQAAAGIASRAGVSKTYTIVKKGFECPTRIGGGAQWHAIFAVSLINYCAQLEQRANGVETRRFWRVLAGEYQRCRVRVVRISGINIGTLAHEPRDPLHVASGGRLPEAVRKRCFEPSRHFILSEDVHVGHLQLRQLDVGHLQLRQLDVWCFPNRCLVCFPWCLQSWSSLFPLGS